MESYPSINWWEGNLRPYESLTLFLIRFCELNGTTPAQCCEYLGLVDEYAIPTAAEIERIAVLLNENLAIVQTVFNPTITLRDCARYCLPPSKAPASAVRYCEECAVAGYHSYLHEAHWLSKCPFHMRELKNCPETRFSGAVAARRSAALKHVMTKHSRKCSRADEQPFTIDQEEVFDALAAWVEHAGEAARRLSKGQIWYFGEDEFLTEGSLGQAIGWLRALVPMSQMIEPLFADIGVSWQMKAYRFPMQCRTELERLKPHIKFCAILGFYKRVGVWAVAAPKFVKRRRDAQAEIERQHGVCRCSWGRVGQGWSAHWERVNPEDDPHLVWTCPYDGVMEELELRWGRADQMLSRRSTENELIQFISLSHVMHGLGLIRYAKDAEISPEGRLYAYPQVWPCCEWMVDSVLTELLELAALFEVEAAVSGFHSWLGAIDADSPPQASEESGACVRLCESDDGLILVKWSRAIAEPKSRNSD